MARTLSITVPQEQTEALVSEFATLGDVVGVTVQPGASRQPPGDLVGITLSNSSVPSLMQILARRGLGTAPGTSVLINEMTGLISSEHWGAISREREDVTWEEMEYLASRDSHTHGPGLGMMAISGALAVAGFATNQVHLIIAGQLLAPHYKSILQIPLGLAAGSRATVREGFRDVAKGYLALLAGAALAALAFRACGVDPMGGKSGYVPNESLLPAFTGVSPSAVATDALAALAGVFVLITYRRVFISGVIVAITLLPSAAAFSMALVVGDGGLAEAAALRWAVDAALVVVLGLLALLAQRVGVQRRAALQ